MKISHMLLPLPTTYEYLQKRKTPVYLYMVCDVIYELYEKP